MSIERQHWISPIKPLAIVIASFVTTGCLNSSPGSDGNGGEQHDHGDEAAGRLAVTETASAAVRTLDLSDEGQMLDMSNTVHENPSIYTSPEARYAVLSQRNGDLVQFLDGGLYAEDHEDHQHEHSDSPMMLSFELTGAQPTHYETYGGQSVVFYDGNDTGSDAGVDVLSDHAIGDGHTVASASFSHGYVHGAAQIVGDHLFATPAAAQGSALPEEVVFYELHGDHFHEEFTFNQTCESLHGSASNQHYTLFGCGDGVMVIDRHDPLDSDSASLMVNPAEMPEDHRVGSFHAHEESDVFIGIAGGHFYRINPETDLFEAAELENGEHPVAAAFDAHGEHLLILDESGLLHKVDAAHWDTEHSVQVLEQAVSEDGTTPVLARSLADDHLYITDPQTRQIIGVDTHHMETEMTMSLDFEPAGLAWLGIESADDHEHDEHDDHDDHDHD